MGISASQLRQDVYRLIDHVLETGEPLEIERKGRLLHLVAADPPDRLSRLRQHPEFVAGDLNDLVSIDWSGEWNPSRALDP